MTDTTQSLIDLRLEREKFRRTNILKNFDEIAERLQCGQTVNLETFVPSDERRTKRNAAINKTLEEKQKL